MICCPMFGEIAAAQQHYGISMGRLNPKQDGVTIGGQLNDDGLP